MWHGFILLIIYNNELFFRIYKSCLTKIIAQLGGGQMKSYILKIEMIGFDPLIWRRVIMPAGATFKRLHDTIQGVTNFSSILEDFHLYKFDLTNQENISVTNDEQAYLEQQNVNPDLLLKKLEKVPIEFREFERRRMQRVLVKVRKPQSIKIDKYLEKYQELNYMYDFGDGWRFTVKLEKVVDDYYFGYPTLLEGEQDAPPEDVGGIPGFYHFLEIFEDETHPEHDKIRKWVESQRYRPFNREDINGWIKNIHYKKTEWSKIKHRNYEVLEDKYVK